jgi:uncharacterized protein YbcC (UPF0753/DUF2309 family)
MTLGLNQLLEVQITDARFVGANAESLNGDYRDEATLDAALIAAAAGTYNATVLASMTTNDKIYALRIYADPLSFGTPGTTTGVG